MFSSISSVPVFLGRLIGHLQRPTPKTATTTNFEVFWKIRDPYPTQFGWGFCSTLGGGFKCVLFSSLFGEDEPFLTNSFQRGWFNHQPPP